MCVSGRDICGSLTFKEDDFVQLPLAILTVTKDIFFYWSLSRNLKFLIYLRKKTEVDFIT